MPGVIPSLGELTRLDLPIPLFLSDQPFSEFRSENYTWEPSKQLTMIVRKRYKPLKVHVTGAGGALPSSNLLADDSSVGGCPLECPFDPNENFEEAIKPIEPESSFPGIEFSEEKYESLCDQDSRRLLKAMSVEEPFIIDGLHLNQLAGKYQPSNPVYLAIDGIPDQKEVVLLGMDHNRFLELRMLGPYKAEDTIIGVDHFNSYHQELPNMTPAQIKRQVHAIYEKVHGEFKADGKVFIEFVWPEPKTVFEPPPAQNARVKLAIRPIAGDANPFLASLWSEVDSLKRLLEIYNSLELSELNKTHQSLSMADTECAINEDLNNLLNQQSAPVWDKGFDFSDSLETVLERVSNLDRSDVDFTDHVWTVLRRTASSTEITECFHQMCSSVEAKLYRPYLFPGNTTKIGDMFKSILGNESLNFRAKLTNLLAMEMTLDCGIQKLYKDYAFILKMCRLGESYELGAFAPRPGRFSESVQSIEKLHCILEVLCLSRARLSLPMAQQEAQTRTLFQYFATKSLDWNHTFHFDVPMNSVSSIIFGMSPIYWNLKLESSTSLKMSRTNIVFSRDFFVSHARQNFRSKDDGTLPRGYYFYIHRQSDRLNVPDD